MYDITFITKEEKDQKVKKIIQDLDGRIISEQFLGRKKFAYSIKKEDAGFYISYLFDAQSDKIAELNKKLKLDSEILRYLIIGKKLKPQAKKESKKDTTAQVLSVESKKIEPMPQEKEITAVKAEPEVIHEVTKEETKVKKDIEKKTEKKIVQPKTKIETIKTKVEKTKPTIKPEPTEKPLDDVERLKKLEEKLDELLKE